MADPDPERPDDPWMTLAEIAEELRMSPATIRSWISRGRLQAMRAGQRKWLVRRSELDRMLRGEDFEGAVAPPPDPSWMGSVRGSGGRRTASPLEDRTSIRRTG